MAGQRGRDVLIRIGTGGEPESFVSIAGIKARRIALGTRPVDVTTTQSAQAWRELMAGAGTKTAEVAGSGTFKDAASDELMRASWFGGDVSNFELVVPGFGVLVGPFVIAELTYTGEHDDEMGFSIRLASAGVIGFEAE